MPAPTKEATEPKGKAAYPGHTAARNPHQQPVASLSQLWQCGSVDALASEDVHVEEFGELLRRKSLSRAENHMPRIVHGHA